MCEMKREKIRGGNIAFSIKHKNERMEFGIGIFGKYQRL